jgi:Cd2+/Zn2+-exporting ATPase
VNFLMVAAALGAAIIGEYAEGSVLMFLFSASGALESYASGRSRRAIQALVKLSPSEATLWKDGVEKVVPVASLKIGDILIVLPGERFAGDGVITEGNTSVDQSSITGESMPVDKAMGDRVMAGTINRFGVVKFQMDREIHDTTLAKIFKIVEEAQQQKAPTQRLIDQYGGPYTKLIVVGTIVTFLVGYLLLKEPWQQCLYRAMTLMVVASPCALVLSIPSAVLAAIANGAWHGILFKGGRAIEIIGQANVIAFDKTGTLTQGKPRLTVARYAEGLSADAVLSEIASIEQNSEHPLAQVLVQEARRRNLSFERAQDSHAVPGMGMEGKINGQRLRIGSEAFVCLHGGMEPWVRETLVQYRAQGLTCLVAAKERPLAVFGVSDQLRPASIQTVRDLDKMGIKVVMLTGDNAASAAEFARQLGLQDFRAGLLPHQKVKVLQELAQEYQTVAMVGDGVNDAPALVSASVGIAMGGSGSDVALENSEIVLMGDDIDRVPDVVRLGRKTLTIIRQNLIFALGVILTLIVLTFLNKLTLAAGVIGHEGSTLLVIFNSLRLLRTDN